MRLITSRFLAMPNEKMRIVQLGPMPPPHGGVSTNMLAIHRKLVEFGHESTIIDVTDRGGEQNSAEILKPSSAIGLARLLFRLDFDVVHYHIGGEFGLKLAMLTLLCGLLPKKKSVVTFHSGGYAGRAVGNAKPFSFRGFAFRSVDCVIGVNMQMIEMFRSFGVPDDRVRMIPPFELRRPDPSVTLPPDLESLANSFDPCLLSVGALEPEYLNGSLIESMPAVLDRFPNAGLFIVGSGSKEADLRKQIDDGGLGKKVFLTGNLPHEVVLHLIKRSDVMLRITEYDGDAISVREAIFLGTPVIASDNEKRPEGVFLVKIPLNSGEFMEMLLKTKNGQFADQGEPVIDVGNSEQVVEVYRELVAR